jgi:hypothetical protein
MAEYFKNKIIGKLSDNPIIVKKITPQPKTETIIPIVDEPITEPETISEESVTVPNETVIVPNDTVITPEETEVPLEEPTPKKSRKKKV